MSPRRKPTPAPNTPGANAIGPMSILHLLPVIGEVLGEDARSLVLARAGVKQLPEAEVFCDEAPAAAIHQALREAFPEMAEQITRNAGGRTGDWILATRMPPVASMTLSRMPPWLAAPVLCGLIEKHAWTFAGSGDFRVANRSRPVFELENNPVVRGETSASPLCSWHAAVFERLFRSLIDPDMTCIETHCSACGDSACRFEIT